MMTGLKYICLILFAFSARGQDNDHWEELRESLQYKKHQNRSGNGSYKTDTDPPNWNEDHVKGGGNYRSQRNFYPQEPYERIKEGDNFVEYDRQYEGWEKDGYREKKSRERREREEKRRRERETRNELEKIKEPEEPEKTSINEGSANVLVILGIILLAVIIAIVLFQILKNREAGNKKIRSIGEDISPEEISKTELELALEKALSGKDYRAAIRIHFLFMMKDLTEKGWIKWEKDKTNIAYLYEMREQKEYEVFEQCVTLFELVWYGKREINKEQYERVVTPFKSLLNKLGVK